MSSTASKARAGLESCLARRVPRYTSYPTAPHFTPSVNAETYARWLRAIPRREPISLYLHVPFCRSLCLYCGCHTTVARRKAPRLAYAERMIREIELVGEAIGGRIPVAAIHWGGGTPSALPAETLREVHAALRRTFAIGPDTELSVEIDPRHFEQDSLDAFAAMGITRASLGVQDLDPVVQAAIGRVQDTSVVVACMRCLHAIGVRSVNLDVMYGLPCQTVESARETALDVALLSPERVSVFGYAHVPWVMRHQALMPAERLPDAAARFRLREAIEATLLAAGYRAVGLDHFAKPNDPLSIAAEDGTLRRNFQGYTTDRAATLLGFGASAIGRLAEGHVQNAAAVAAYGAAIDAGTLPTARGVAFSGEDRLRGQVIEDIMCRGFTDLRATAGAHGVAPDALLEDLASLRPLQDDGLVEIADGALRVTRRGHPVLRVVAAAFDRYLAAGTGRHSAAV